MRKEVEAEKGRIRDKEQRKGGWELREENE